MAKGKHAQKAERRRETARAAHESAQELARQERARKDEIRAAEEREKADLVREIVQLQEKVDARVAAASESTIREIIALESFLDEHEAKRDATSKLRDQRWQAVRDLAAALGVPSGQFIAFLLDCSHLIIDEVPNAPRGYSVVNQRRHYGAKAVDRFDALLDLLVEHPATVEQLEALSKTWSREVDLRSDEPDDEQTDPAP